MKKVIILWVFFTLNYHTIFKMPKFKLGKFCNLEKEKKKKKVLTLTFKETKPLTPALLTKASIWPNASQPFCMDFSMVGPSALTSSSRATARSELELVGLDSEEEEEEEEEEERLLIWSQSDWSRSTRRAAAMILQPALARSRQNSRPIPADAPVTNTTLPFSSSSHGSNAISLWFDFGLDYCFADTERDCGNNVVCNMFM